VLGIEEMNDESTLKPGNIASIIGDMSGIQIQQSSAVSGNSNVRIQGLEGKYTQVLRDGMPLFEGYSGGFGILTIPPLDLRQVELIKGAASTLIWWWSNWRIDKSYL
jgi:iron complex outermembrane receptor protein/outer membrane receptor for ferrienterochelin and colicins